MRVIFPPVRSSSAVGGDWRCAESRALFFVEEHCAKGSKNSVMGSLTAFEEEEVLSLVVVSNIGHLPLLNFIAQHRIRPVGCSARHRQATCISTE